jgi:hypothetical protein
MGGERDPPCPLWPTVDIMNPADFDTTSPGYVDDWDARLAVWRWLEPGCLPETLGLLLAEQLRLLDYFNGWLVPPDGLHPTDRQRAAARCAADLEAATCRTLLEWHHDVGTMEAAVVAMNTLCECYRVCSQQAR